MKHLYSFVGRGNNLYLPPLIETFETLVESGFAGSSEVGDANAAGPTLGESDEYTYEF